MRLVITVGGNALLKRGEVLSAENQRANVRTACAAIARIMAEHEVVLSHGNGPQVGLLALQNDAYKAVPAYPFDILGAQSQAMIGVMMVEELKNLLPEKEFVNLVTRTVVSAADPAFDQPSKFIGPVLSQKGALLLQKEKGWVIKPDGEHFRRVIASPEPIKILELPAIKTLLDNGFNVIAAGGGGVPVIAVNGAYKGIEAVIDKDFAASLLAIELKAERLIIATDVDGVYEDWGKPHQKRIDRIRAEELLKGTWAPGSMAPKVKAACQYVLKTKKTATIGALHEIEAMVADQKGTVIVP